MNTALETMIHIKDQYYKAAKYLQIGKNLEGVSIIMELGDLNKLPVYLTSSLNLDVALYTEAVQKIGFFIDSADSVGLSDYLLYSFVPLLEDLIALSVEGLNEH